MLSYEVKFMIDETIREEPPYLEQALTGIGCEKIGRYYSYYIESLGDINVLGSVLRNFQFVVLMDGHNFSIIDKARVAS